MKPYVRRLLLSAVLISLSVPVQAHPGHEGDELTWDFGHLAAHPWATIGCLAVFVAAGGIGWRWMQASADRRRRVPVVNRKLNS